MYSELEKMLNGRKAESNGRIYTLRMISGRTNGLYRYMAAIADDNQSVILNFYDTPLLLLDAGLIDTSHTGWPTGFSPRPALLNGQPVKLIDSYASEVEPEKARAKAIRIRVNDEEMQKAHRMAKDAGQTVSDFIREKIGL